MIIKAKAPFRIGLAGGGTDVDPYASLYGGEVINATIGLYARVALEATSDGMVYLEMKPQTPLEFPIDAPPENAGDIRDLFTVTYNRFIQSYGTPFGGLCVTITSDVPYGSGLGTSSTLMVTIIGALLKLYGLQWTPEEIAAFAVDTERNVIGWAGGKQDQYAAVYGGFNHMWFGTDGTVKVQSLSLSDAFVSLLEQSMLLYYSKQHRHSSRIIEEQQARIIAGERPSLEATHALKQLVENMHDSLIQGNLASLAETFALSFAAKKKISSGISTQQLESVVSAALAAGAKTAKISGAGGGGFLTIICSLSSRTQVQKALHTFEGQVYPFHFTNQGLHVILE
jgi:D-glycero-alpha-D-manno-heptose-7-phosphate kinase